jgi:hypothetical protein
MSVNITTAFVNQFKANVDMLVQQKGSRLSSCVEHENITGESAYFEQIGSTEAVDITSRHMDTPRVDTPHERRRVTTTGAVWADLIDREDKLRMLIDPTSDYAKAAMWALGRKRDDVIIAAADGVAYTGKDGSTQTAFDTNMVVDVQTVATGVSAADAGLNVEKLLAANELLMANDVDPDEKKYCVVNARQVRSLLGDTRVTSHDFNTLKPLVSGTITEYAGFTLIPTQRIGTDANSDDKCLFWVKSGMKLAIGADIEVKISERADKNYSMQVWARQNVGCTRMEETKVGYIECDIASGPTGA